MLELATAAMVAAYRQTLQFESLDRHFGSATTRYFG